ncbi:LuxR C-terminal-related transcriptional regulator [Enterobacter asburiae]|uniref:helix-turn-helix domain-containing protein n=1 Tax=Enterobacter sp. 61D5 TaxID=3077779 RepID=UPI001887855F|nr:response regulator transcription factor [Enterobacter asburiae]
MDILYWTQNNSYISACFSNLKSGKTGIELSREMFRSQKTISTHKRKIMLKLGVKNDLELRKATHKLQPPH